MNSREIDEIVLTLVPSGWTYNYLFVLWDYETGSMWYPTCGLEQCGFACIAGKFAGSRLSDVPATLTNWNIWKAKSVTHLTGGNISFEHPNL